jgi:diguanylate cyclase (GGDEF)-like protein
LLNRREMERRMQTALENAVIDRSTFAVVMIDLDGFKAINDRFGHGAGDDFLRHVATSLREAVRAGDLIARFGGDEFLVLLERTSAEAAMRVSQSLIKSIASNEFLWTGQSVTVKASLGVGMGSVQDSTWVSILERADTACYEAKNSGGNCARQFSGDSAASTRSAAAGRK